MDGAASGLGESSTLQKSASEWRKVCLGATTACKHRSALGKDFAVECLRVAQAVLSAAAERQKCPCKGFTVYSKVPRSGASCVPYGQCPWSRLYSLQQSACEWRSSCVPYSQCPWSRLYSTVLVAQAVQAVVGAAAESQKCPCKSFTVYSEVTQCRLCSVRQVHPWSRLYSKVRASGATCVRRLYSDLCGVHTQKSPSQGGVTARTLQLLQDVGAPHFHSLRLLSYLNLSVCVCWFVPSAAHNSCLGVGGRCARTQAFELQQDAKL